MSHCLMPLASYQRPELVTRADAANAARRQSGVTPEACPRHDAEACLRHDAKQSGALRPAFEGR
jgi:hypothetical protein